MSRGLAVGSSRGRPSGDCESAVLDAVSVSSLVGRVRLGDQEAWGELLALCEPWVRRWARMAGVSAHDAEDLAQDVFVHVLARIHGLRDAGSFPSWLHAITHNKLADFFRAPDRRPVRRAPERTLEALAQVTSVGGDARHVSSEFSGRIGALRRAMETVRARLQARTWEAFWAVVVDGRDGRDIAAELNMTAHAVHQAVYRTRHVLQHEIAQMATPGGGARWLNVWHAIPRALSYFDAGSCAVCSAPSPKPRDRAPSLVMD